MEDLIRLWFAGCIPWASPPSWSTDDGYVGQIRNMYDDEVNTSFEEIKGKKC